MDSRVNDLQEPAQSAVVEYYEEHDESLVWGRKLVDEYIQWGNTVSHNNNALHLSSLLTIASRTLKSTRFQHEYSLETPTIHTLTFQQSGSGKTPAYGAFARMVAEQAGMEFINIGELTDAGLIGKVTSSGEKYIGPAGNYHLVYFDEASVIFRTSRREHSKNLPEHLNQIMDNSTVVKSMSGGKLEYKPKASLLATSYIPDDIDFERFLKSGTMSRFLTIYRDLPEEFYKDISRKIIEDTAAANPPNIHETPNEDLADQPTQLLQQVQRLATVIEALRLHYDPKFRFNFDIDGSQWADQNEEVIFSILDNYPEEIQEACEPDITRNTIKLLSLGCLFAALDYCSEEVQDKHMKPALGIIEETWKQTLDFVQQHMETDDEEKGNINTLNHSDKSILKALFREDGLSQQELAGKADVNVKTVQRRAPNLVANGLITNDNAGKQKVYHLNKD